jgi:hypothetical protein
MEHQKNDTYDSNSANLEPAPIAYQPHKVRRFLLLFTYFSAIPIFVLFLILFSLSLKYEGNGYISRQLHKPQYQALPSENDASSVTIQSSDARIASLNSFFAKYESPLQGHADTIVAAADKNNIDYRLLPAIAMQESTLCKKVIKDSFNCWGFGIYGKKVTKFTSYDEAINVISATLAKKYVQKGFVEPDEIVHKYTPGDTGKWASVVSLVMSKLTNAL